MIRYRLRTLRCANQRSSFVDVKPLTGGLDKKYRRDWSYIQSSVPVGGTVGVADDDRVDSRVVRLSVGERQRGVCGTYQIASVELPLNRKWRSSKSRSLEGNM